MDFDGISWLAVVAASLVFFIFGALWYGPVLGSPWRRLVGVPEDAAKQAPKPGILLAALVVDVLAMIALAAIIDPTVQWGEGLGVGLLIGVLIAGTTLATQYLFEQRPLPLLIINVGYNAVGFAIAGAIIGALQ